MKPLAAQLQPAVRARLSVSRVLVEPAQVWFECPRCEADLEGFGCDPRGQSDPVCEVCGERFDIPSSANIVIV